jgi:hypothetical protein
MLTRGFDCPPCAGLAASALAPFLAPNSRPEPDHGAVGALPLIFIDGARQEALDGVPSTASRRRRSSRRWSRSRQPRAWSGSSVEKARAWRSRCRPGPALLAETRDDDRQLMRRQGVGVMQHRGDRQVLAAHRAVDDHLQALDRREGHRRSPSSRRRDRGLGSASALASRALAPPGLAGARFFARSPDLGLGLGGPRPLRCRRCRRLRRRRSSDRSGLVGQRGIDHLREGAGAGRPHQRARRDQVGEIERRNATAPSHAAPPAWCRWPDRA